MSGLVTEDSGTFNPSKWAQAPDSGTHMGKPGPFPPEVDQDNLTVIGKFRNAAIGEIDAYKIRLHLPEDKQTDHNGSSVEYSTLYATADGLYYEVKGKRYRLVAVNSQGPTQGSKKEGDANPQAITGDTREPASSQPATSPGGGSRAAQAMNYFQSQGWSTAQAAGIVGNLQSESGQNLDIGAVGDNGQAFGIAQWHPDRQANFQQVMGTSIQNSTFAQQLSFVNWELHNSERGAGFQLSKETTAAGAAASVDKYYERSSGATRGARETNADRLAGTDTKGAGTPDDQATAGGAPGGGQSQSCVPVSQTGGAGDNQNAGNSNGGGAGGSGNGTADGLKLKSSEATAGGSAQPGLYDFANVLQTNVNGFNRFTAFNDLYHQGTSSKHAQGLAMDFTVTNASQAEAAASQARSYLSNAGINGTVINEYANPSENATGGHIHVQLASTADAQKAEQAFGGSGSVKENTNNTPSTQETSNKKDDTNGGKAKAIPPIPQDLNDMTKIFDQAGVLGQLQKLTKLTFNLNDITTQIAQNLPGAPWSFISLAPQLVKSLGIVQNGLNGILGNLDPSVKTILGSLGTVQSMGDMPQMMQQVLGNLTNSQFLSLLPPNLSIDKLMNEIGSMDPSMLQGLLNQNGGAGGNDAFNQLQSLMNNPTGTVPDTVNTANIGDNVPLPPTRPADLGLASSIPIPPTRPTDLGSVSTGIVSPTVSTPVTVTPTTSTSSIISTSIQENINIIATNFEIMNTSNPAAQQTVELAKIPTDLEVRWLLQTLTLRNIPDDQWNQLIIATAILTNDNDQEIAWFVKTILNRCVKTGLSITDVLKLFNDFDYSTAPNEERANQIYEAIFKNIRFIPDTNFYFDKLSEDELSTEIIITKQRNGVLGIRVGNSLVYPGAKWP